MKQLGFLLIVLGALSVSAVSVTEFGAKGDGVTDDTAAIQRAIDFVAERGGGKITFPYAPKGCRIAAPGRETWKGRACRAQLCIPAQPGLNIAFEGEMPCKLLYSYQVRPKNCAAVFAPTRFGTMGMPNTCLFSDWAAPAVTNAAERPWAILAAACRVRRRRFGGSGRACHLRDDSVLKRGLEPRLLRRGRRNQEGHEHHHPLAYPHVWTSSSAFML